MSDWALYLGMAAFACAACSLLGAGLAQLWGVDSSREAPGTHKKHAARRLNACRVLCFAAVLPGCLWLGAHMGQTLGKTGGSLASVGYALLCAMLSFCALFVSVRHDGKGMAHVCSEELFGAAGKARHALGCAACVLSAGAILMSVLQDGRTDVAHFHLFIFSCTLWPMLSMQMAADSFAPVMPNEGRMLSAASGGAVCAALIAMLMLLPGSSLIMSRKLFFVLGAGIALVWLVSWAVLCCLGGRALHALLERPLVRKRRRAVPETLLCAAASIALALTGGAWVFEAAAMLCALTALMDISACTAWLSRIGRGLFSKF